MSNIQNNSFGYIAFIVSNQVNNLSNNETRTSMNICELTLSLAVLFNWCLLLDL